MVEINPNRSVLVNKSLIGTRRRLNSEDDTSDDEDTLLEEFSSTVKSSLLGSVRSNFLETGIHTTENSFRHSRSRNISLDLTKRGISTFDSRFSIEKGESDKVSPKIYSAHKEEVKIFHMSSPKPMNMKIDLSSILKTSVSQKPKFVKYKSAGSEDLDQLTSFHSHKPSEDYQKPNQSSESETTYGDDRISQGILHLPSKLQSPVDTNKFSESENNGIYSFKTYKQDDGSQRTTLKVILISY